MDSENSCSWGQANEKRDFAPEEDPGVLSVLALILLISVVLSSTSLPSSPSAPPDPHLHTPHRTRGRCGSSAA
jgi:hypothetical protein